MESTEDTHYIQCCIQGDILLIECHNTNRHTRGRHFQGLNGVIAPVIKECLQITRHHWKQTSAMLRKMMFQTDHNVSQSKIYGETIRRFDTPLSKLFVMKYAQSESVTNPVATTTNKHRDSALIRQILERLDLSSKSHMSIHDELCDKDVDANSSANNNVNHIETEPQFDQSTDVSLDSGTTTDCFTISSSAPAVLCHVTPVYLHTMQFYQTSIKDEYFSPVLPVSISPVLSDHCPCSNFCTPIATSSDFFSPTLQKDTSLRMSSCESFGMDSKTLKDVEVASIDQELIHFVKNGNEDFILIGQGSYGCVYLAELLDDSNLVCVKEYYSEVSTIKDVVHEAKVLTYLQDTGVVPEFHGVMHSEKQPQTLCLVMEFYANGVTLKDIMYDKEYRCGEKEVLNIINQLIEGLALIHEKGVLWNDIKPDNVLIDCLNENRLAFIDFGVATVAEGRRFCVSGKSDLFSYLAPEVRIGNTSSFASDVYSLGYLIKRLLERFRISNEFLLNVVQWCVSHNPETRPGLQELLMIINTHL